MRDITIGQKSPAHMTAEEDFWSLPKWAEHVSCGEMATAFISVGAYYAYPQRLKISRECRLKGRPCDELRSRRNNGLRVAEVCCALSARMGSIQIERPLCGSDCIDPYVS